MKKILFTAASVLLMMGFLLAGCGSSGGASESGADTGGGDVETSDSGTPSIDLSQIDWNVESGIVDGYRCVVFGYTNNTDYEVVDFELDFKVRDGVTNEELEQYSELKEKAEDMEHDIGEITFSAMTSKCVAPGGSIDGQPCNLDGTIQYYTDFDSYEVFEPDKMTVGLASGGKLYGAYYDFSSQKTTVDDDVIDAYTWSNSALAKTLPKPEVRYLIMKSDDEDYLSAEAYGVSKETYEDYVNACKAKGYDQKVDESGSSFSAENADGVTLDVSYYSSDDQMSIFADKPAE